MATLQDIVNASLVSGNLSPAQQQAVFKSAGIELPEPSLFEKILQGVGSGAAIGTGIYNLTNQPTTTTTRDIPGAGGTELGSLARLQALQGGLLSDVGYRETPGATPGQTTLTDVGVPPTQLGLAGQRLGQQAGMLLGGGGRLQAASRQKLIQALQARMGGGGGVMPGGGTPGPMNFTGSATGPGFTSTATTGGARGRGGPGASTMIGGALGALPALWPYAKDMLGLGGPTAGAAATPATGPSPGASTGGGISPTSIPPMQLTPAAAAAFPNGQLPSVFSPEWANYAGSGVASSALDPPIGTTGEMLGRAMDLRAGLGETAAPTAAAAGQPGGGLGLNLGTAMSALQLAGGLGGLIGGKDPGQRAAGAFSAASGGLKLAGGAGLVSPASVAAYATPLALFAAIPAIASIVGAFKPPNRSTLARYSIQDRLKGPINEFLQSKGAPASNLGEGGIEDLYNSIPGGDEFGVKPYIQAWEQAAREVAPNLSGPKDTDRAASILLSTVFTSESDPEQLAKFFASLGASPETLAQAFAQAQQTYNPKAQKRALAFGGLGQYSQQDFDFPKGVFEDMPQVQTALTGLRDFLDRTPKTSRYSAHFWPAISQFQQQMVAGGLSSATAARLSQMLQQRITGPKEKVQAEEPSE